MTTPTKEMAEEALVTLTVGSGCDEMEHEGRTLDTDNAAAIVSSYLSALEAENEELTLELEALRAKPSPIEVCGACGGTGTVMVPVYGHGCCGNYTKHGECCGNAVEVDLGPEYTTCPECNGRGRQGGGVSYARLRDRSRKSSFMYR